MRSKMIIGLFLLLSVLVLIPISGNLHWTRVFIEIYIWIVVSLCFRLILTAGLVSLAQMSFMGLGAYTVAILTTRLHWNYWVCFPLAGAIAAFIALVIGFISLRTKGIYFVFATFAIAEVIRLIWIEWNSLFGGVGGIPNIPAPNALLGLKFGSLLSFYYFSLLLGLFTLLIMYRLEKQSFVPILLTLDKSEDLSKSVGINTFKYKNMAFVIGSFFTGLTGAFGAAFYHYVGPDGFTIQQGFYVIIYVLTGGAQTPVGTVIGVSILMVFLKLLYLIPGYNPVWEPLVLGIILVMIMKFLPGGLISVAHRISSRNACLTEKA